MSCREDRIELMKDVLIERSGEVRLHECIDGLHKGCWIVWDGDKCVAIGAEAWARKKFQEASVRPDAGRADLSAHTGPNISTTKGVTHD